MAEHEKHVGETPVIKGGFLWCGGRKYQFSIDKGLEPAGPDARPFDGLERYFPQFASHGG